MTIYLSMSYVSYWVFLIKDLNSNHAFRNYKVNKFCDNLMGTLVNIRKMY